MKEMYQKGIMMNIYYILAFIFSLPYVSYGESCELKKVFHNQAPEKNSISALGNVVLYCNQYPQIKEIRRKKEHHKETITFLLDKVKLAVDAQRMLKDFNKISSVAYSVRLHTNKSHQLELNIEFNPNLVSFSYEFYETITKEKGVIFWFHNQKLLKELGNKEPKLLQVAQLAKPTVIIDCGHGGSDTGAVNSSHAIAEKDITLAIGKKLEIYLKNKGFSVCMTRSDDSYIALDERTKIANAHCPHAVLISLHANSAPSAQTSGIETYCLHNSLFEHMYSLCTTIDVMCAPLKTKLYEESEVLAQEIQSMLISELKKIYPAIVDRKVKHAGAQVLVGTLLPASLIELGFVSHEEECLRLNDHDYQQSIVVAITQGFENFLYKRQYKS